jgi:lipopolysaccharide export system protein LptC
MKSALLMLAGRSPVPERAIPAVYEGMPDRFRRAYRHSRRVRLLRRLVPGVILGGGLLTLAVTLLAPLAHIDLPFNAGRLSMSGTVLTMETPRLSGYTRASHAYRVVAAEAKQDLTQSNIVDLKGVRAEFEMANGGLTRINAGEAVVDTTGNKLLGSGGVEVITTTGFHGTTEAAEVDTKAGTVTSKSPVDITTPTGQIQANQMEILDEGNVFLFAGGVRGFFRTAPPDPQLEKASDDERSARVLAKEPPAVKEKQE